MYWTKTCKSKWQFWFFPIPLRLTQSSSISSLSSIFEHVWQRFLERVSSRREYRLEAYATLGRQQCSIGFQPVSDAAYAA